MSVFRLPSCLASVDMVSMLGEKDYIYPLAKKNITKALTEALDELWLKQKRIEYLEAEVKRLNPPNPLEGMTGSYDGTPDTV